MLILFEVTGYILCVIVVCMLLSLILLQDQRLLPSHNPLTGIASPPEVSLLSLDCVSRSIIQESWPGASGQSPYNGSRLRTAQKWSAR